MIGKPRENKSLPTLWQVIRIWIISKQTSQCPPCFNLPSPHEGATTQLHAAVSANTVERLKSLLHAGAHLQRLENKTKNSSTKSLKWRHTLVTYSHRSHVWDYIWQEALLTSRHTKHFSLSLSLSLSTHKRQQRIPLPAFSSSNLGPPPQKLSQTTSWNPDCPEWRFGPGWALPMHTLWSGRQHQRHSITL